MLEHGLKYCTRQYPNLKVVHVSIITIFQFNKKFLVKGSQRGEIAHVYLSHKFYINKEGARTFIFANVIDEAINGVKSILQHKSYH